MDRDTDLENKTSFHVLSPLDLQRIFCPSDWACNIRGAISLPQFLNEVLYLVSFRAIKGTGLKLSLSTANSRADEINS